MHKSAGRQAGDARYALACPVHAGAPQQAGAEATQCQPCVVCCCCLGATHNSACQNSATAPALVLLGPTVPQPSISPRLRSAACACCTSSAPAPSAWTRMSRGPAAAPPLPAAAAPPPLASAGETPLGCSAAMTTWHGMRRLEQGKQLGLQLLGCSATAATWYREGRSSPGR